MPLSHEHVGFKIVAKIKIYILIRAELLLNLCYEIPCKRPIFKICNRNILLGQQCSEFFILNITNIQKL